MPRYHHCMRVLTMGMFSRHCQQRPVTGWGTPSPMPSVTTVTWGKRDCSKTASDPAWGSATRQLDGCPYRGGPSRILSSAPAEGKQAVSHHPKVEGELSSCQLLILFLWESPAQNVQKICSLPSFTLIQGINASMCDESHLLSIPSARKLVRIQPH